MKLKLLAFGVFLCVISICFKNYSFALDMNQKQAKYEHKVQKEEEKEKYERAVMDRKPSGYMTIEEYEKLSVPQDRMEMDIVVPKTPTPADIKYVPQPTYKIVRYNNPPGSPELTITNNFYKRWQQNSQGIVSPSYDILVYPSVYSYPNTGSTACDLFVIKLDDAKTNLDKILTAHTSHRIPEPILSTVKDNENYYTFRTLTPIDFSSDGSLLLAKQKVGNTKDGIWETTPFVYDFETKQSYNLVDVRHSIEYYWKENANLLLTKDKRWDITPLGFEPENNNVIVTAVAYTGDVPVNLGVWSISAHGENPKLLSLHNEIPSVGMNGYKLIQDGVVEPFITKNEEKLIRRIEKDKQKQEKREDKAELKEMKQGYKAKIKEMDADFKESQKDYALRQKINSTTSENEAFAKYQEIKEQQAIKRQQKLEKLKAKELKALEKQRLKEEKAKAKANKKSKSL